MLRTLVLALVLTAPGLAAAEQFPRSAVDAPVVADDGAVLGRVAAVERDERGRIVSVEIPGLEPADAPRAPERVAEDRRGRISVRGETRDRVTLATARRAR